MNYLSVGRVGMRACIYVRIYACIYRRRRYEEKEREEEKKREKRKVRKGEGARTSLKPFLEPLSLSISLFLCPRILGCVDDGCGSGSRKNEAEDDDARPGGERERKKVGIFHSLPRFVERREPASTFAYYAWAGVRWSVPRPCELLH